MIIIAGLWGAAFDVPKKEKTKAIVDKVKKPKEPKVKTVKDTVKSKSVPVEEKVKLIIENVYQILGHYKDNTVCIRDYDDLVNYIEAGNTEKILAIDTETNNSLDPITCKLMGLCLYAPGQKNAYVPVNHVDIHTKELLPNQLTEFQINSALNLIKDSTVCIFHNGKFDYQVIKCTCDYVCHIDWDTLIGAKVLDENEMSAGLKAQYIKKIDPDQEKYSIEHLFEKMEYAIFPPEVFALYAATDPYMTFKLYEWQKKQFELETNIGVYNLFKELEMPLVKVIAEMEMTGMAVDQYYAGRLSNKYHTLLDDVDKKIEDELLLLKPKINDWRLTPDANVHPLTKAGKPGKSKSEQLTEPINLASPTQLAILFYDILKAPQVSRKSPRGTGEDELKSIDDKMHLPIVSLLLQRREYVKLITTYIDVIPELAKRWPDGRVRTHFNQYGAATGRLSSSEPLNFQNIPSHNREIRMLFCAKPGYRIIGGDFSAQEPRLTAFYANDPAMLGAYAEGKDLYAVIASMSFDKPYEDCLEFYPEGTVIQYEGKTITCGKKTHQNKDGKGRRTQAKSILLGLLYGRGAKSVGEQIGKTAEEAQEIIDKFFKAFPKVKEWIDKTHESAYKLGYVEDIAGRRRRLPDLLLPKYTFDEINKSISFNPLLGTIGTGTDDDVKIAKYQKLLDKCKWRGDVEDVKKLAEQDNLHIHDNSGFIAQAERQSVNSRVQGGAATLTKQALIDLYNNERLRELDAHLINTVHDEILMECPEDVADECAELLCEVMKTSAKKYVPQPAMSVDAYIVTCWYLDEFMALVESEFKKLLDKMDDLTAFETICKTRSESSRSQLYEIVSPLMKDKPADADILIEAINNGDIVD